MDILFFTGSQSLKGGTERACADIATLLSEHGLNVTIMSLYSGTNSGYPVCCSVRLHELFSNRPRHIKSIFGGMWCLLRYVRKKKPHVLVAVESLSFLYFLPLIIFPNRPRLINWEHFNAGITLQKKSRTLARRLAVFFADYIVVLSEFDMRLWQQLLGCPSNILVKISNLNPFDGHRSKSNSASSSIKLKKTVVAVGRLTAQKGFDLLIKSWAIIPESVRSGWHLKIFGEGPDRDLLEQQIKSLGLHNQIKMPGQATDIAEEFRKSDLFVLSSRFEGFGLVLLEALSCGLPVVSFDCPAGPAEILTEGVNGLLVPPEDTTALASAMTSIMQDNCKRLAMAEAADTNLDRFNRNTITKEWQALLSRCTAEIK